MKKRILLSFLACSLSAGVVLASEQAVTEIYVSKTNGNDSNDGSASAPFKTVETAVFSLKDNTPTKIHLEANAVFDLEAPLNLDQNKQVEIVGENTTLRAAEKSAVEGGEGGRILRAAAGCDVKVSGITFKNGRQVEYILGGGIFFGGNTLEVDNCRFIDNQAGSAGGAIGARGKAVIITNSYFEGNNLAGGGGQGAAIMQAGQKTTLEPCSLVVKNCTFNKNFMSENGGQGTAIGGYDATQSGAGGSYVNLSYVEISNCTFLENTTPTAYQAVIDMSHSALSLQDCYIVNNTFYGNDGAFRFYYNEVPFYFINNVVYAKKSAIMNEIKIAGGREPLVAYNNVLIGDERGVNEYMDDESLTTKAAEYNNTIKTSKELPVASLGLASTLSTDFAVPYLAITSASSPLVDAGLENSADATGENRVPSLDIRGYSISGKKDIGAFEYNGGSSINEETQDDVFYTIEATENTITISNLDSNPISVKIVTVDGKVVYSKTFADEISIDTQDLGQGLVIINLNNGKAVKSIKAIL